MKRKKQILAVGGILMLTLSGCTGDMPTEFVAVHDEGITTWEIADATMSELTESEPVLEQGAGELEKVDLEADIVGIYEISEDVEESDAQAASAYFADEDIFYYAGDAREQKFATSRLTAGKEYEISARVLLSTENETILGQELDFLLTCPTLVEQDKKSNLTVSIWANGSMLVTHDFAVTATSSDLTLQYVPETYTVHRNGAKITPESGDLLWNEDLVQQQQTLDYLTCIDRQLGVYEYTLSYHVRAEISEEGKQETELWTNEPISLSLRGISQEYEDERDRTSALLALNDCLRDNYLMRESLQAEGTAYLVAEVHLPEWAREYAEEHGLLVSWYNYDVPGCGIGVNLPSFPDNLGHVEKSFNDLTITTILLGEPDAVGMLMPCPATPLSIWVDDPDADLKVRNLTLQAMPEEIVPEPRYERSRTTQLLGGEIIKQLPTSGSFYIVIGTDITYRIEEDG